MRSDESELYKLITSDVLSALSEIKTGSVDFVFADPPYFLSNDGFTVKSGKAVSVNKGEWDRSAGFEVDLDFHRSWIHECLRVLNDNGSIAISGTYHSIYMCGFVLQEAGCRVINEIVWFKPNGAPSLAGRNFTASHETVIWASKSSKKKHVFNYPLSKSWDFPKDKLLNTGKQMRSVWSIPTTPKSEKSFGHHPTQKPIELLRRLILLCTLEGQLVLDPFCGSGTTGVVSVTHGRNFIGIDLEPEYIELSNKRIGAVYETYQNDD